MTDKIPYIPAKQFAKRRQYLLKQIGKNGAAIVPAAVLKTRNRDAEYSFRQDSDFLYLTHFNEPNAIAVFVPKRKEGEFILFCQEKDPKKEQWTGIRAGIEGAKQDYGADQAFSLKEIDEKLPELIQNRSILHYTFGQNIPFDQRVTHWVNCVRRKIRQGIRAPHTIVSLDLNLHEMRLFKSKAEIKMMQYAADLSAIAHRRAMQICKPEMYEYQIEAEFHHLFRQANMQEAYTSIVGGGKNACILHYIENKDALKDGDLLLIDAGAEHEGYASDITRTFPINGKFSETQGQLYSLVLDAQKAAIAEAIPGNPWNAPHDAAVKVLTRGLRELGLLKPKKLSKLIEKEKYKPFYMHKTGHWLGLDVHDVGDYRDANGDWRILEPGMILTVEPGLYISPNKKIAKRWWNIGIRIEDDVLITEKGNHVLSADVPKEIDDIENLMA